MLPPPLRTERANWTTFTPPAARLSRRYRGKLFHRRSHAEEKDYNRGLGSFRVAVEHRIGRTKRFRIVAERFRNPRHTHHTKTSIIAGLVNIEAGFSLF